MPIYEYICSACHEHHEILQKISDEQLKKCPSCGQECLEKLISAASFRLSGSGWYETDFKTGNRRNLAGDQDKLSSGAANKDSKAAKKDKTANSGAAEPAKKAAAKASDA